MHNMQTVINKTMNIQLFPYPKKITAINPLASEIYVNYMHV